LPWNSCTISWSKMERIEITTRFRVDGSLAPIEFSVGERTIKVRDVGRQWESEGGRHLLVMDFQGTAYHLLFQLSDLSWYWVKDIKPADNSV
jgi:hypothetical protein